MEAAEGAEDGGMMTEAVVGRGVVLPFALELLLMIARARGMPLRRSVWSGFSE